MIALILAAVAMLSALAAAESADDARHRQLAVDAGLDADAMAVLAGRWLAEHGTDPVPSSPPGTLVDVGRGPNVSAADRAAATSVLESLRLTVPTEFCPDDNTGAFRCAEVAGSPGVLRITEMVVDKYHSVNGTVSEALGDLDALELLAIKMGNLQTFPPNSLSRLLNLTSLTLSGNAFDVIPHQICALTGSLTDLDLSRNGKIARLPSCLSDMASLETLDLSENGLETVPRSFGAGFRSVERIDFSLNRIHSFAMSKEARFSRMGVTLRLGFNRLTAVPPSLASLQTSDLKLQLMSNQLNDTTGLCDLLRLSIVDLADNNLGTLPECVGRLHGVHDFNLGGNGLSSLPASFVNLTRVSELTLDHNEFEEMPDLRNMRSLSTLSVRNNRLLSYPEWMCRLPTLFYLDLEGNQIAELPDCFGNSPYLSQVRLRGNNLSSIPASVANLSLLSHLDLAKNAFYELPDVFYGASSLGALDLSFNFLTSLPPSINANELPMIGHLTVSRNRLESISEAIFAIKSLTILKLDGNKLESVPDNVFANTDLNELDLANNRLQRLPAIDVNETYSLDRLDVSGNELIDFPRDLRPLWALNRLSLSGNVGLDGPLPRLPNGASIVLMARCNFSGPVHDEYGTISSLLDLSGNRRLEQVLGSWTCSATSLFSLVLSQMDISGDDIGHCESPPFEQLFLLDLSGNALTGSDVGRLLVDFLSAALKSLDVSDNPIGSLVNIASASFVQPHIALRYLNLRNTSISWLNALVEDHAQVYDRKEPVPLIEATLGVLDVSENELRLMTAREQSSSAPLYFRSQEIRCEGCFLEWGPEQLIGSHPFGFSGESLLTIVGSVQTSGTPYIGALPSPDNVPHLAEVDIFSAESQSFGFEGSWFPVPSDVMVDYGSFQCPAYVRPVSSGFLGYRAVVHPNFYDFRFCRCLSGFFGVVPLAIDKSCEPCPDDGNCPGDGSLTIARKWAVHSDGDLVLIDCPGTRGTDSPCESVSVVVHDDRDCFESGSDDCRQGQWAVASLTCADGHDGETRLCSRCLPGYYSSARLCFKCHAALAWIPVLLYIGKVVVICAAVLLSSSMTDNSLRIFTTHLSLFIIMTNSAIGMPGSLAVLGWFGSTGSGGSLPGMECVTHYATYEHKFFAVATLPAVVSVIFVVIWLAGAVAKHATVKRRAISVALFLWLTYLLSFVHRIFAVLNCTSFGSDDGASAFITDAMWISCSRDDGPWHTMRTVAITYGVIIVVGTLSGICAAIGLARKLDHDERLLSRLAFLFSPYKEQVFFWELILALRHIALALSLALCEYESITLPVLIFSILFLSLLVHLVVRPYVSGSCNNMETLSLAALLIGFFVVVVDDSEEVREANGTTPQLVVVVLNILIVLLFAVIVGYNKVSSSRRAWKQWKEKRADQYSLMNGE